MRFVGILILTLASSTFAQGTKLNPDVSDSLLRKLVEKGVLTIEEARETVDQAHLLQPVVVTPPKTVIPAIVPLRMMSVNPVPTLS